MSGRWPISICFMIIYYFCIVGSRHAAITHLPRFPVSHKITSRVAKVNITNQDEARPFNHNNVNKLGPNFVGNELMTVAKTHPHCPFVRLTLDIWQRVQPYVDIRHPTDDGRRGSGGNNVYKRQFDPCETCRKCVWKYCCVFSEIGLTVDSESSVHVTTAYTICDGMVKCILVFYR